jgi:hypothetical protein
MGAIGHDQLQSPRRTPNDGNAVFPDQSLNRRTGGTAAGPKKQFSIDAGSNIDNRTSRHRQPCQTVTSIFIDRPHYHNDAGGSGVSRCSGCPRGTGDAASTNCVGIGRRWCVDHSLEASAAAAPGAEAIVPAMRPGTTLLPRGDRRISASPNFDKAGAPAWGALGSVMMFFSGNFGPPACEAAVDRGQAVVLDALNRLSHKRAR